MTEKKKENNLYDLRFLECRCGDIKFGNRDFAEKAGWDFDNTKCPKCRTKKENK